MNSSALSKALGVKLVTSSDMDFSIAKWRDMYMNKAEWIGERVESIGLPSAISSEFARMIMTEFRSEINDGYLNKQYQKFAEKLFTAVDIACAMGGVLFKPYVSGDDILTDIVRPTDFFPVSFSNDVMTSVICPETVTIGKDIFIRCEFHSYDNVKNTHTVHNLCFHSDMYENIRSKCRLSDVPQWAGLKEYQVIENVDYPLFCYFKMPFSNNIDMKSPLGISVFSKAETLIKQADRHWERILWEFESSERAIDATEDIFRMKNGKPELPRGRERMFRTYSVGLDDASKPFIETFSPEIRDNSLFNGLNRILQRIEFSCGLAYGTISDISAVEKTAEEIKTSKQRSYMNVCNIQKNLENALRQLVYCYGVYSQHFGLAGKQSEFTCTFGDSVLEDTEKEFQRRLQMVNSGLLSKEHFISWYFGCSVEEAVKYLPQTSELFGGEL